VAKNILYHAMLYQVLLWQSSLNDNIVLATYRLNTGHWQTHLHSQPINIHRTDKTIIPHNYFWLV